MSGIHQYHLGRVDKIKVNRVLNLVKRCQAGPGVPENKSFKVLRSGPLKLDTAISVALQVLNLKLNPAEYEAVLDLIGEDL